MAKRKLEPAPCMKCPACNGTGQVTLWPKAAELLEVVPHGEWISTSVIFARYKGATSQEALINRLTRLERLKLIASKRSETNKTLKLWQRI